MIVVILYSDEQQCSLESHSNFLQEEHNSENCVATLSRIGQVIILYD